MARRLDEPSLTAPDIGGGTTTMTASLGMGADLGGFGGGFGGFGSG